MGLFGPPRTKFGRWLDDEGISQSDFARDSGVSVKTVSDLARGRTNRPSRLTMRKFSKALKKIAPDKSAHDFWEV